MYYVALPILPKSPRYASGFHCVVGEMVDSWKESPTATGPHPSESLTAIPWAAEGEEGHAGHDDDTRWPALIGA